GFPAFARWTFAPAESQGEVTRFLISRRSRRCGLGEPVSSGHLPNTGTASVPVSKEPEMDQHSHFKYHTIMPKEPQLIAQPGRSIVVQGLSFVEDVVYIGLGVLLTIASVTLLWVAAKTFVLAIVRRQLQGQVVGLLDQILLI